VKNLRSFISIGLVSILLGGFLIFWIHEEYKRELTRIATTKAFSMAKEIISIQTKDLDHILGMFSGLQGSSNMIVQIDVDPELEMNSDHEDLLKKHMRDTIFFSEYFDSDSFQFNNDSVRLHSQNYSQFYDSTLIENSTDSKREALISIWPQIIIALILYILVLGSIAILRRGYRLKQSYLQEKNILVSNLTHELKTPVSTISVALEALQSFNLKQDERKSDAYMNIAKKEIKRLTESIDLLMDLNAMDNSALLYKKEPISILTICHEIKEVLTPHIEQKKMKLNIDGGDQLVYADKKHLQNAIMNIIDNAIKYGRKDGEIIVLVSKEENYVSIEIKDNGIGISKKDQMKIFDRFYRTQKDDRHNVKGHGLGLSYTKEIIEAHNGSITVKSDIGMGTTFKILMPHHG